MHVIYCLQNESLKENILNVGLALSMVNLTEIVEQANATFLPTPYTIFLTKKVSNPNRIDIVYSLLCKFGKHLSGSFFEISSDFIIQLFDMLYDDIQCDDIPCVDMQEKYRIIQDGKEYIIPRAFDDQPRYAVAFFLNEIDNHYDHLKSGYIDLDL